jgi:hypothetical protein
MFAALSNSRNQRRRPFSEEETLNPQGDLAEARTLQEQMLITLPHSHQ